MLIGVKTIMRRVRALRVIGLVRERIAAVCGHKETTRIRNPVILAVDVRAHHEYGIRMACRADDALVIPALARAKVVGRITRISRVRARLVDERRRAGLDRLGDEQAAVRRAAIAFCRVHPGMTVGRRRERELTPHRARVGHGVNVRPCHAVVGRTPDAHIIGGRVDHARMRRIDRESGCAAGRSEARFERLARLRAQNDGAVLDQRKRGATVRRLPHADARRSRWDLRDRACGRRRDAVHAAPGGHVDRVAGRIVKIIDRDCPGRAVGEVGIATEGVPRFAAVGRLVNANAGFCVAGRCVFAGTCVERVVRRVIG